MKKVLLTLLAVIVIAGALGGAGFAGYRIGYQQGALASTGNGSNTPFMHDFRVGPQDIPMHNFGRGMDGNFERGSGPGGLRMRGGMIFGFFPPLAFLGRILFWGLLAWFVYWLFTKSGWQLTRKAQPVEAPKVEPSAPEQKEA